MNGDSEAELSASPDDAPASCDALPADPEAASPAPEVVAGASVRSLKESGASGVRSSAPACAAAVIPNTPAASDTPTGAGAIFGRPGSLSASVRRAGATAGSGSTGAGRRFWASMYGRSAASGIASCATSLTLSRPPPTR